jgi:hypothetical protein
MVNPNLRGEESLKSAGLRHQNLTGTSIEVVD